jgi:hypothetical protein
MLAQGSAVALMWVLEDLDQGVVSDGGGVLGFGQNAVVGPSPAVSLDEVSGIEFGFGAKSLEDLVREKDFRRSHRHEK